MNSSPMKPWFVLVGPTAVGKSAVSEILAQHFQTDIIVADSRQVYQKMEIGTGKPDPASRKRVFRHLIDFVPPDQIFSAGAYKKRAERIIAEMEKAGKPILIEGGTGLYVKALLYRLWEGPPADWDFRKLLLQREKAEGEGTLHRLLSEVDPILSAKLHPKELQKIIRALEVQHLTGRPLSEIHAEDAATQSTEKMPHTLIGLNRDRDALYRRIDQRVENYIAEGLVDEVRQLLASGLSPELPSMRGLGYRQLIPHLRGEQSLDEAIAILKRDTRRFAKRQMTWFRADQNIQWLDLKMGEAAEETSERIMRLKKKEGMV